MAVLKRRVGVVLAMALMSVGSFVWGADVPARGVAEHVVVVVMDGLRPDSVTKEDMPVLFGLKEGGVFFAKHHPVYLSSTEVNGAALATGCYPRNDGVISNTEYLPGIELLKPVHMEELETVRKGDAVSNGGYLKVPTVAEIVEAAGKRSVVAGTKPVAILLNRAAREWKEGGSVDVFAGKSTADLPEEVRVDAGKFPATAKAYEAANSGQDDWTVKVLVDRLWGKDVGGVPAFTTMWFSEPDFAQHGSGPGSDVARRALASNDEKLGRLLDALKQQGVLEKTDVMVVSDHGFSTIGRTVVLVDELKKAGFSAADKYKSAPKDGDVVVVSNGGSESLYVMGHDPAEVKKLVAFLQGSDFCGVIFTKGGAIDGTFDMSAVKLDSGDAPDILFSMRWMEGVSATGMAGMIWSEKDKPKELKKGEVAEKFVPKVGNHTTLSRYDMHNTLIASGPDFKAYFVDETATGNIDVGPTVLWILGIAQPKPMDGRVLREAMAAGGETPVGEVKRVTATSGKWLQYLQTTTVEGRVYFDEGNGGGK